LRQWGLDEQARTVDQTPIDYEPGREWFTLKITPVRVDPPRVQSDEFESSPPQPTLDGEAPSPEHSFYLTFAVFDPGEHVLGSPSDEPDRESNETQHRVRITRPFAILDREITRAEAAAFGLTSGSGNERTSATPDHPIGGPNWYDAVRVCRWLTEQHGLSEDEQAYPDPKTLDPTKYPMDPQTIAQEAPRDWPVRLDRPGFRLPTEAEWEVACRGGMGTSYAFGGDVTLLGNYGWFQDNSEQHGHLPRSLRPNMRGLFDMYGNVWEWCHDWAADYPIAEIDDPIGPLQGKLPSPKRVRRGGGWGNKGRNRSAERTWYNPAERTIVNGVRVAVTPSVSSQ
jgi:formylglycine-generating enzyme required for sulfatase activity